MLEMGKPIRTFYTNLLRFGIVLEVDDNGRLVVTGNTEALSPVYRDEIMKRASMLVDLLTAPPENRETT